MNLLDEIERMIGNEYLINFEQIDLKLLSLMDIKELPTNFLAQPHANKICDITD